MAKAMTAGSWKESPGPPGANTIKSKCGGYGIEEMWIGDTGATHRVVSSSAAIYDFDPVHVGLDKHSEWTS